MASLPELQAFKETIDNYIDTLVLSLSSSDKTDWEYINRLLDKAGPLKVYGEATETTLDETNETITYEGFIDDTFQLFQRSGEFANATLEFTIDDSGIKQCTIAIAPGGSYRFSDSFPALAEDYPHNSLNSIVFKNTTLELSSKGLSTDDSVLEVAFEGDLQPQGAYRSLQWLFIPGDPTLSGTLQLTTTTNGNYVPLISKGAVQGTFTDLTSPDWGYLDGLEFTFTTRIYTAFDDTEQHFTAYAELLSTFSKPDDEDEDKDEDIAVPIVMSLYGEGQGLLSFYLDTDSTLPDFNDSDAEGSDKLDTFDIFLDYGSPKDVFGGTDISYGLLSLESLAFTLNPETQQFSNVQLGISLGSEAGWSIIADKFALENIAASLYLGDPKQARDSMSVTLQAVFHIGDTDSGVAVFAGVDLPSLSFSMGLWEGDEIAISGFLKSFVYRDTVLEKEEENTLAITTLNLSGNIEETTYSLTSEASGAIEIISGFSLSELEFTADYASGAATLYFSASFILTIDGADVTCYIEADKDPAGAWDFTGGTVDGDSIPIGDLITDLASKFGITTTIPEPINSLTLENLAIAYNNQSKDFSFSGEALFSINGVDFDIVSQVDIAHLQDGTTGKSFSGSLTLGTTTPKVFDLVFDTTIDSTLMLAGYHSVDGDTVSIADLAGAVTGLTIPDVLSFTLKDAVLVYDADTEYEKTLFATHMGNGIDLSNLPLVGKLFTGNQAIILNYQIVAASQGFTASEVADINALLPDTISSLGEAAIASGLSVSVKMDLSGDEITLALPVAINQDPEVPNPDSTPENPLPPDPVKATSQDDSIKWLDIQKSVGPVHFNRIGVAYTEGNLEFALDASFSMGGLEISLDGLSVSSPLTRFEPYFDLKGLGIDYKNAVMEIGGAFLREHIGDPAPDGYDEYDGVALLKMETLSLSAIGSYAYVNGKPSLFIYAALNYPLGGPPFFFVTGLSLGFGYNRALYMPSVDKVLEFPLVAEAMNGKSLPAGAGKDTLTAELEAIHSYIPVSTGQLFLAAGISFTTFKLIDSTILLAASFGNRFEMDLLGVSTLIVPPEADKTPLAVVQMTLKGAFIPEEGFVGLRGQLTSASYILSKACHLSGGFAFYTWYQGEHSGDFVATIGGYHPHFKKPDHYPSVPRLAFSWQLDSHTHIKGNAYFALCAHTLMAGGYLEAVYEKGALKAWYKAGADFLVAWKPYHYEASVHVHVGGSYTYHFFGTHHITVDVGADVSIWGPEFGGHARIDLSVCSISMDFGASRDSVSDPDPVDWDTFNDTFLPSGNLCTIAVSAGLVSRGEDKGLLTGIAENADLTGFTINYDNKSWIVGSDTEDTTHRTIVIGKRGETDKTIVITLSDSSVTIDGQPIGNPDETITVSDSLGIVNPKELALITDAFVPSKTVNWSSASIANTNDALWATDFGIGAMGINASDLSCSQTITVEKYNATETAWEDYSPHFTYTVNTKKAPAGLWGEKIKPGVNDAQFIGEAFAGLEIVPGEGLVSGESQDISRSSIQYETSFFTDAIAWQTRASFTDAGLEEAAARNTINTSIKTNTDRDGLLQSLGISATIDLTESVADDLILAPQVEEAVL